MKLVCSGGVVIDSHQKNQEGDSVCLMLLTPLATVSAYLCSSGASYYAEQGQVAEAVSNTEIIPLFINSATLRLTAGGSCRLVFGSLPSLPSLAPPHCQIPLSGHSCLLDGMM